MAMMDMAEDLVQMAISKGNDWAWIIRPADLNAIVKLNGFTWDGILPQHQKALACLVKLVPTAVHEEYAQMPTIEEMRDELLTDAFKLSKPRFVSNEEWDACDAAMQRSIAAIGLAQVEFTLRLVIEN